MKKTATILILCMLATLVSCGKDEPVEESKPLNIQKSTLSTTEADEDEPEETTSRTTTPRKTTKKSDPDVTTLPDDGTTTSTTKTATFSKRSTAAAPNVSPSRGTVRVPTNTTNPKKTTSPTTTTTNSYTSFRKGDISCAVMENGIQVSKKGKVTQFISIDTSAMMEHYSNNEVTGGNVDPATIINIIDYDFDGYNDMYIPQNIGSPNSFGVYLHFNPETKHFEPWEELKDIKLHISINEDRTLSTHCHISAVEFDESTYNWTEDGELELIALKKQYRPEDSDEVYLDFFEYPDGEETLVKRQRVIIDDEMNITDYEDVDIDKPIVTTKPKTTTTGKNTKTTTAAKTTTATKSTEKATKTTTVAKTTTTAKPSTTTTKADTTTTIKTTVTTTVATTTTTEETAETTEGAAE